jgi:hypothetical protein
LSQLCTLSDCQQEDDIPTTATVLFLLIIIGSYLLFMGGLTFLAEEAAAGLVTAICHL